MRGKRRWKVSGRGRYGGGERGSARVRSGEERADVGLTRADEAYAEADKLRQELLVRSLAQSTAAIEHLGKITSTSAAGAGAAGSASKRPIDGVEDLQWDASKIRPGIRSSSQILSGNALVHIMNEQ
jgi:hypothetical protein